MDNVIITNEAIEEIRRRKNNMCVIVKVDFKKKYNFIK